MGFHAIYEKHLTKEKYKNVLIYMDFSEVSYQLLLTLASPIDKAMGDVHNIWILIVEDNIFYNSYD